MGSQEWAKARKILCVRLDTIGDVLMTTPAIRAIKEAAPDRQITLLTSSKGSEIARLIPELDEVGIYDPLWMKSTMARDSGDADRSMIERLRRQDFDAAVIFTVYSQSAHPAALLTALADVPLRLAYSRENPYGLLTDWVKEPEPEEFVRHEVRRHLDLVEHVGAITADERLSLEVPPEDFERVHALLRASGADLVKPWVIVHPGASAASRRYPAAAFGRVARLLRERDGVETVFTGTSSEKAIVSEAIREAGGGIDLSGKLELAELSALIAMADLIVTNNTAPAHIAAAVATPVVDLYALTNPQHTPWEVPSRVLYHDTDCKYCYRSVCPLGHHDCLEKVSPEEVVAVASQLLAESHERRSPILPLEVQLAGMQPPLPETAAAATSPMA